MKYKSNKIPSCNFAPEILKLIVKPKMKSYCCPVCSCPMDKYGITKEYIEKDPLETLSDYTCTKEDHRVIIHASFHSDPPFRSFSIHLCENFESKYGLYFCYGTQKSTIIRKFKTYAHDETIHARIINAKFDYIIDDFDFQNFESMIERMETYLLLS